VPLTCDTLISSLSCLILFFAASTLISLNATYCLDGRILFTRTVGAGCVL
jgi:hypothetical protein